MSETTTTRGEHVCALTDLTVNTPAKADVGGVIMALVRTADDTVYAVEDECTHASVSLCDGGSADGERIECWLHGAQFCLRTGEPQTPPATAALRTYPVVIDDGQVYVSATPR